MEHYKIDVHVHTRNVSSCSKITGRDVARYYKKAGYYGIVITDHYYDGFFGDSTELTWEAKIDKFLQGYQEALQEGTKIGLQVFLGMEIRFIENNNDYLIFGADIKFLKSHPKLFKSSLMHFNALAHERNVLIYQAHPFRPGIRPADPALLDGVEVFNGNARHNSRNELAYQFAVQNDLPMISGSDFHQLEDLGRGGIIVSDPVTHDAELVSVLKKNGQIGLVGLENLGKKP